MTTPINGLPALCSVTLLRARELAVLFGVRERTIYRWRREGKIPPPIRIGGSTRWRRDDIERFFNEQRRMDSDGE